MDEFHQAILKQMGDMIHVVRGVQPRLGTGNALDHRLAQILCGALEDAYYKWSVLAQPDRPWPPGLPEGVEPAMPESQSITLAGAQFAEIAAQVAKYAQRGYELSMYDDGRSLQVLLKLSPERWRVIYESETTQFSTNP